MEGGEWNVAGGALQQKSKGCCIAFAGDPSWKDFTLTLKARKTSGQEGFLVVVHNGDGFHSWCNIGGWGNSGTAIEQFQDGDKLDISPHGPFKVETGKWYDIRLEVKGAPGNITSPPLARTPTPVRDPSRCGPLVRRRNWRSRVMSLRCTKA
jgi:alpha-L-arabinofuranosidase